MVRIDTDAIRARAEKARADQIATHDVRKHRIAQRDLDGWVQLHGPRESLALCDEVDALREALTRLLEHHDATCVEITACPDVDAARALLGVTEGDES